MADFHPSRCPEPEVLAAYVDRDLSLTEQSRVEAHLASCHQCVAVVAGVVRTVAEIRDTAPDAGETVEVAPSYQRTLVGVVSAAAAVIAIAVVPFLVRPWLDRDAGLVSLVGSSPEFRSVLGRLSGGYPHAPLGSPSAGGQGGGAADSDRIHLIAGKIRESFGERETPSRLHELGISQLLAGRYDDAARSLLAASRERPNDARYLNDVATVHLERGRLGLRPDDLPRALAAADRARRLDPALTEAWFNRALAATSLSLRDQAATAWTEYLDRDSTSPWAAEARAQLEELSKPTAAAAWQELRQRLDGDITPALAEEAVRTHTTGARTFVETELISAWASAVQRGQNASRELDRLRAMADALARVANDALYRDAVQVIDRAEVEGNAVLRALADAHSNYVQAAAVFGNDRFQAAIPVLRSSRGSFAKLGSPFAARAQLDLSAAAYFLGQSNEAAKSLEALVATATRNNYSNIAARASWQLGLAAFGQGRLGDAQVRFEETLATFDRMGDTEQEAAAHNLLAGLFGYLGDEAEAWKHLQGALVGLDITLSPRLRYGLLSSAALAVRRQQNSESMLSFQDAVLESALSWGSEGAVAEATAQRASVLALMGRHADAEKEIGAARRRLARVADRALRNRLEVNVLTAESDVKQRKDPAGSLAAAEDAIRIVEERGDRLRLAQLNLRMAKASLAQGRLETAEAALNRGIKAFDEERASISDEGRISVIDESWQLFEAAVLLAVKRGDYPRAFEMADQARSRTLAESRVANPKSSLSEVERAVGPAEAVIGLMQHQDELLVWIIRSGATKVVTRSITRLEAANLVARQQDEISHGAENPIASAALYNELVRPLARELEGVQRLVVVPDAPFDHAAFGALFDSTRKKFLVETVVLSMSPSISAFVSRTASQPVPGRSATTLILGSSQPGTDTSVDAVAAVYPNSQVVTGVSATPAKFLSAAPTSSVVHVAARTANNQSYPLLSRMLLADDPGQRYSGALLGRDIAASRMSQTRLVVLDEVESASSDRGEGTLGLARAFMAAGVPAVLGTLPGADQAATRDLIVGFHRLVASSRPADEALTELQRSVLQSNGRRIGAWSALVLYGSDR